MMQEKEANRQAEQGKAETEIPCAVCRDLIPLVQDGVASPESEALVKAHLQTCPECRTLWQAGGGQPFGASVNRQQGRSPCPKACPHPMMPACCKRSATNTIPVC